MELRFRLIRNRLGEYGVLDRDAGTPTPLQPGRDSMLDFWTRDRLVAESAMAEYEAIHQRSILENIWEEVK